MAANMEALRTASQDFLRRCRALLQEEIIHPVDITSVQAIEQDLQLSVVAIRQYYNASPFAPINRLHAELLGMIFQYIRAPSKPATPAKPNESRYDSYKHLLAPMLVCHRWHALITQNATLWNEIDLVQHDMTGPFVHNLLQRSKEASLNVRFGYPGFVKDGRKKITSFLKTNAHRFRELEVKLQSVDRTSKMLPLLEVAMPRLVHLSISLSGKEDRFRNLEDPPKNVHSISFARIPGLRALALSGTLLRPKECVPSLTHLHLVGLANDTISPLLEVLRAAPSLEVLDLRRIKLSTQNVKHLNIPLPRLRMLRMSDCTSSSVVHFLLTDLVIPNLAVAHFYQVYTYNNGDTSAYIPPAFLAERTITRFSIRGGYNTSKFTATLAGPDFQLTLDAYSGLSGSILSRSPLSECLRSVENACIEVGQLTSYNKNNFVWLASCLPKVKSVVFDHLQNGLFLLSHPDPILFPELVSLGIDSWSGDVDRIARSFSTRAQLVGGPLPFLRVGKGAQGLKKSLNGKTQVIGKLEVVQFSPEESLRDSNPLECSEVGHSTFHGYWGQNAVWNYSC